MQKLCVMLAVAKCLNVEQKVNALKQLKEEAENSQVQFLLTAQDNERTSVQFCVILHRGFQQE